MVLDPVDAADPDTAADFEAGRDYYGPSPAPLFPCVDPPGMPGKIAEMKRRADAGLSLFAPGADAGEEDRIGFLGSRWGYAEDDFTRRRPVVQTAAGLVPILPAVPRRTRRPSELCRDDDYRAWDAARKRAWRKKRKAERAALRAAGKTGKVCRRRVPTARDSSEAGGMN